MTSPRTPTTTGNDKLVIVPDSCTLSLWSAQIPEHFFVQDKSDPNYLKPEDRPKQFYEIFEQLPRSKVRGVHILDIIGGETFGRTASGKYFDDEFMDTTREKSKCLTLSKKVYDPRNGFYEVVKTRQGDELIKVLSHLREFKDSIKAYLDTLPKEEAAKIEKDVTKSLREARKTLSMHKGEALIKEYLLAHPNPTFFISDEKGARDEVVAASKDNHYGCIYVDNSAGFLEKLTGFDKATGRNGDAATNLLVQKCGFNEWVRPQEMMMEMSNHVKRPGATALLTPHSKAIPGTRVQGGPPKPAGEWLAP